MKDPPEKNVLFPAAVPSSPSGVFGVAINNRGEVLLEAILRPNSAPRAFLFSGGRLKELPPPPRSGPATYKGLNDLGWLVGSLEAGPASRGFLARPFKD